MGDLQEIYKLQGFLKLKLYKICRRSLKICFELHSENLFLNSHLSMSSKSIVNVSDSAIIANKPGQTQPVSPAIWKAEIAGLAEKIAEMQSEQREHKSVLQTPADRPADRRTFHLINGILVEKSVGEIIPILQTKQSNVRMNRWIFFY